MRLLIDMEMLSTRSSKVLNYIVGQYITATVPVPSQTIADEANLGVSPATIRNEMAYLEKEGYLIRPYTSAGCIPSDKGYRYYVESIEDLQLPWEEKRLISHTFHQVEREVEAWVSLSATLLARLVKNVAIVSLPKPVDSTLKHLDLIHVEGSKVLAVVVLDGARVKQQLLNFEEEVTQSTLAMVSNELNNAYNGLTSEEISAKEIELSPMEKAATEHLLEIMQAEDSNEYQAPYLEGWQFILNQPEFARSDRMSELMELVERRGLLKVIEPARLNLQRVHVIIGKENRNEAIQNCSVVIGQYGLPQKATGSIAVVGPTRMPYSHTIPTVYYLSSVLSQLIASLYQKQVN